MFQVVPGYFLVIFCDKLKMQLFLVRRLSMIIVTKTFIGGDRAKILLKIAFWLPLIKLRKTSWPETSILSKDIDRRVTGQVKFSLVFITSFTNIYITQDYTK